MSAKAISIPAMLPGWMPSPWGPILKDMEPINTPVGLDWVLVYPGSKVGADLGFTSEFYGWLYIHGKEVYVSFIEVKGARGGGAFNRLLDTLWRLGYTVKVPTPLFDMPEIVRHKGFTLTHEHTTYGLCEVWVKGPRRSYA